MSTRGNKKTKKIVTTIAIILAVVLVIAVTLGIVTNWYRNWKPLDPTGGEQNGETGGLIIGESSGANGISLLSEEIPLSEYKENGISPLAEKAYTLTAVILPEDAGNKLVDWTASFANASSSWASGKKVSDYVTITPVSDGALTANVECLQAFGEQIIITVTSREKSEVSACKPCDYVQTLTAYTVNLGDFNLVSKTAENFGQTQVYPSAKMELGRYADGTPCVGAGGAVNATFEKGTVYTVENDFSVQVTMITDYYDEREHTYPLLHTSNVHIGAHGGYIGTDITESEIRFDRTLFDFLQLYKPDESGNRVSLSSMSVADLITLYENRPPDVLYITAFKVHITGTNCNTSVQVNVVYDGYTNSTPVQDIQWAPDTPPSLLF